MGPLPRIRAAFACALAAALLGPAGVVTRGADAAAEPAWLARLNAFRAQYGAAPVDEDSSLERGIAEHSRYIVKTDDYGHDQNRGSGWSTAAGRYAGARSNIAVDRGGRSTAVEDVDAWMTGPFHALAMLDPRLTATAFASYYEATSPEYTYGSGLDVVTHRDGRARGAYPLTFPGHGSTIPVSLTTVADEVPDPLAPCGYAPGAGLPIMVSFGPSTQVRGVTSHYLRRNGAPVETCATTAASYADPAARSVLAASNTVLVIPRQPLAPGAQYTASVTVGRMTETFSFGVARAPSSIAATATAATVTCGGALDVVASLDTVGASPANQPLELWQYGGRRQLATQSTNRDGWLAFTGLVPLGSTRYAVRFGGNASNLPSRSALLRVTVESAPWRVLPDEHEVVVTRQPSYPLTGRADPGGGAALTLQEQDGTGTWRAVDGVRATAGRDGAFSIDLPTAQAGRHVYRVAAATSGCRRAATSDPVTVVVLAAS